MGAGTELIGFDTERLREVVAPALRALLVRQNQLDLASTCLAMDESLGVWERGSHVPSVRGGCRFYACDVQERCPFSAYNTLDAETVMGLFQRAVHACMHAEPTVYLGRRGRWQDVVRWWETERGCADRPWLRPAAEDGDEAVLSLLSSLFERGAIWGWRDGGFGEGTLGWLTAAECADLGRELDAFPLQEEGTDPDLQVGRRWMAEVQVAARRAAGAEIGLLALRG